MPKKISNKVYHRLGFSQVLDALVRDEAIRSGKSITAVIENIVEKHYTNGTDEHKKLNWIIEQVSCLTGNKPPMDTKTQTTIYDIPKVPIEEIQASRYNRKRYAKKEGLISHKPVEKVIDIFNIKNISQ